MPKGTARAISDNRAMTNVTDEPPVRLRGVNLGGWLVLEKWMTPSLFTGLEATDETAWCVELGRAAPARLRAHWDSFITRDDFEWLAGTGINAVRIPVGHWVLGAPYPHHPRYGSSRHPFVEGSIEVVDRALDWAAACGLSVILDLHAAPGCQNGFDNGGMLGVCEWHTRGEYVDHCVELLGRLAERYRAAGSLAGIEVLNEPRWDVPTPFLEGYYRRAYDAIRRHCPADRVAVVFHDGFRPHGEFLRFFRDGGLENVLFDIHRYQCFERADLDLDLQGHLDKAGVAWRAEADEVKQHLGVPGIAGEWSLGLDLKVVSLWAEGPYDHALQQLDRFQEDVALRAYAAAQLLAFERYRGWFFWSYRTETTPAWCFRECVERGWLPRSFQ
jgi:glucan 1,3-beta-glucosidase